MNRTEGAFEEDEEEDDERDEDVDACAGMDSVDSLGDKDGDDKRDEDDENDIGGDDSSCPARLAAAPAAESGDPSDAIT